VFLKLRMLGKCTKWVLFEVAAVKGINIEIDEGSLWRFVGASVLENHNLEYRGRFGYSNKGQVFLTELILQSLTNPHSQE